MKIIPIPEHWRSRAIVVTEADLQESWFSPHELQQAASFRLPKRRNEFLLSRAAAKSLAVRLGLSEDEVSCRIEHRRIASRYLSLSHSAPYAAAAIDDAPVGIDVQVIRTISENAAHLFLTDAEAEELGQCTVTDRMIHFWCAKEALWKRDGGVIETLRRVPLRLEQTNAEGLSFDGVDTVRIGDVVVALTRPTS